MGSPDDLGGRFDIAPAALADSMDGRLGNSGSTGESRLGSVHRLDVFRKSHRKAKPSRSRNDCLPRNGTNLVLCGNCYPTGVGKVKRKQAEPGENLVEVLRNALSVEQGMDSQAALARRLEVAQSVLNRFVKGKTLSLENLAAICRRSWRVRNDLAQHLLGLDGEDKDVWESLGREFGSVLTLSGALRLLTILREQKESNALDEEFTVLRALSTHVRSALSAHDQAASEPGQFESEAESKF